MKILKLKDICQINPSIPEEIRQLSDEIVSFVPMNSLQTNGTITNVETKELKNVIRGYRYFEVGDVIFAKITPCMENGKAAFVENLPFPLAFGSTEFHILRPGKKIDGRYLSYIVRSPLFRKKAKKRMTGSAGQKRVPVSFLSAYKIPIPPLEVQIRIAVLLSRVEALIAKRRESISLLDDLLKSTFLEMFEVLDDGKSEKTILQLGSIAEVVSGITKGKKYANKELITVPYLRVANVQDGYIDLNEIKEIQATQEEITKYQLQKDDLLLTEGGDADKLGRGDLWKYDIPNCIYQNHLFRVRINSPKVTPTYLCALIGSIYGKKYFLKAAKQTTGIATINSTQLKKFPVIIPPLPLQNQFVQIVESVEATKASYERSLAELEKLYHSLSQRAFRGELFSRDSE